MKTTSKLAWFAAALFALPLIANAHYIWIERDAKTARLYFGEVAEVREQSPGKMDEIKAPKAWATSSTSTTELNVKRTQKYFAITGANSDGLAPQVIAHESTYEVKDWTAYGIGLVKPMYYARHSAWPLKQAIAPAKELKLDIQPVAGSKDSFVVLFDGKPLPKAKAVIYAPNDWEKEYKTDDAGQIKMALPWKGQYAIEVIYKETAAGEFEGKKFDAYRHRVILTVVQPGGINPKGTGGGASGVSMMANNMPMAK